MVPVSGARSLELLQHRARRFLLGTRREAALPVVAMLPHDAFDSRALVRSAMGRDDAVLGGCLPRACRSSCRRVLASLSIVAGIEPRPAARRKARTTARRAAG